MTTEAILLLLLIGLCTFLVIGGIVIIFLIF
jgi:hypothetical protein